MLTKTKTKRNIKKKKCAYTHTHKDTPLPPPPPPPKKAGGKMYCSFKPLKLKLFQSVRTAASDQTSVTSKDDCADRHPKQLTAAEPPKQHLQKT